MTKLVQKSIPAFVASLEQKPFQHIRHCEREGEKKFTQSCATMSPLFYLPAVEGSSLGGKQASGPACGICIYGFWGRVAPMPVVLGSL